MQVVLVMFRAEGERRSFSVVRDVTIIGRREECDLRIPVSEVSRKHCRIIKEGDTLRLEDLGSSNGTFHNGQRVQEATLQPGDSVQVGPAVFVVQIDGVPADDDLQPFADRTAQQLSQPAAADAAADDNLEILPDDGAAPAELLAPATEDLVSLEEVPPLEISDEPPLELDSLEITDDQGDAGQGQPHA
jgi:pSer/pThr/pTyr-binding forkhead associated (FHA) protein